MRRVASTQPLERGDRVGGFWSLRPGPFLTRGATLLALGIVLLGSAWLLFASVHAGLNVFDEGFVATGAMLMRQGALPLRDFFSLYGPAQFALTALAYAAFGEDLWVSRNLHLAVLVAIGIGCVLAAARLGGSRPGAPWVVAAAWLLFTWRAAPPPGYAAVTAALLMLGAAGALAWAFAADAPGAARGRLLLASLLLGLVALLRWDFGLFCGLALLIAAIGCFQARLPLSRASLVGWLLMPAVGMVLVGLLPFIVASGVQRWIDEVVLFYLREFERWRGLELIGPTLEQARVGLADRNPWALARAALTLLYAGAPPMLAVAVLGWQVRRRWRGQAMQPVDVLAVALALLALFTFNQMRVRPGWIQGYPAFVLALPLLACAARALQQLSAGARAGLGGSALIAFVLMPAYVVHGDSRPGWPAPVAPPLARAGGMQAASPAAAVAWADYAAMVEHVKQLTAPGEPIFSGVTDTSRLFINDAMLYFLADRPAATRWVEMEPGQTNSERGQRELIGELQRRDVRVLVLWDKRSTERNATGSSNGVKLFDVFVQQHYRLDRRFGAYAVMLRTTP